MLGRPVGADGQKRGTSRAKVASVLFALWGIGARALDLPEAVVDGGAAVLGGLAGIFIRDAQK